MSESNQLWNLIFYLLVIYVETSECPGTFCIGAAAYYKMYNSRQMDETIIV
jgi:hypothetical protein